MMKRIAIYGAGNYGRTVVDILKDTKHILITFICDSNEKKWGSDYEGYIICPPDRIFEEKNLDGVFISILSDNDVEQYILKKKNIKIYREIHELVSENIFWDVSGKCNAKCKYCVTGRSNRNGTIYTPNSYMSLEMFKKNYNSLYTKGIISKKSHLNLYNWKEPFMNPEIIDILKYCSEIGQNYELSTNGSIVRLAQDKNTYNKCNQIIFSMPGFSQKSYDRIHGFSFEIIKRNIIKIKQNMLAHGFRGRFVISAHIYKFSKNETEELRNWAEKEEFFVNAYYPYLAGNSLVVDYFEDRLDEKLKEDIFTELFLDWDEKIEPEIIRDFSNPLCNYLTIDENANITLCCAADEFCDYYNKWGKIGDLESYDDYLKLRKEMLKSKTCIQCRKYSIAYRILH